MWCDLFLIVLQLVIQSRHFCILASAYVLSDGMQYKPHDGKFAQSFGNKKCICDGSHLLSDINQSSDFSIFSMDQNSNLIYWLQNSLYLRRDFTDNSIIIIGLYKGYAYI